MVRTAFVRACLGRSGAGKSTLLRCINGLVEPTSGEVFVGGRRLTGLAGRELRAAREGLGFIFQQFNLVKRLTALENVLCGRLAGMPVLGSSFKRFKREDRLAALECLERVGLADKAHQRADTLSGGQQQRVALARMLMQDPDLVLADEPVASLDPRAGREVMDLLWDIGRERRMTVLCTLHQLDLALDYAERVVGLKDGRVVLDVPAGEIGRRELEELYDGEPAVQPAPTEGRA